MNNPWDLPDGKLLAECRFETYTASGPGGQKRNKTQAAVRITHTPTKIHAVATDSRSQRENRIHALRNLRHKLAIEIRREIPDLVNYHVPNWLAEYGGLHINAKNPRYAGAIAEVLDVLKAMHWSVSKSAVMLGVTTSALTRFLHDDPPLWAHVNQTRSLLGMNLLRRD
ncbi:MAG: peptide chain release factor-like protein [Chthoniobacterales bacterium]|nr:peptide chain release factor-like protein [Chthoniobacterales bacterium]